MTLVQPFAVFADVMTPSNAFVVNPGYLIGSASNADPYGIATMELTDDDYSFSSRSSIVNISNTVDYSKTSFWVMLVDNETEVISYPNPGNFNGNGEKRYQVPQGKTLLGYGINLNRGALPRAGKYRLQCDVSSTFSIDHHYFVQQSIRNTANVAMQYENASIDQYVTTNSGDWYADYVLDLGSIDNLILQARCEAVPAGGYVDILAKVRFSSSTSNSNFSTVGIGMGQADYESNVSGSLSDISSSIGDMSSSMDSAAENLEYISTSQNLIIQGIDNVIMHISDQLYAFWDQLYNLIHEPTYARLGDILDALKAIANNSDIYAVVETIEESSEKQTADIIANNNANTTKVESAVEKHGNFIIDGLKGLFIPSDEYFKTYFDDLYSYFSDRFGFLSFPIDLLVRLIDLFANSSDRDCILTLPSFEISGEQLISEASFNLTEFLENDFSLVLSSIRMVTSIGLIMAFVSLCQTKWNEVMRN